MYEVTYYFRDETEERNEMCTDADMPSHLEWLLSVLRDETIMGKVKAIRIESLEDDADGS